MSAASLPMDTVVAAVRLWQASENPPSLPVASGRKAAIAIDRYLGGSGLIDQQLAEKSEPEAILGCIEGFSSMPRGEEQRVPAEQRKGNFNKVVENMAEEAATCESERCLQCDLRLKITPVKFWGNY